MMEPLTGELPQCREQQAPFPWPALRAGFRSGFERASLRRVGAGLAEGGHWQL